MLCIARVFSFASLGLHILKIVFFFNLYSISFFRSFALLQMNYSLLMLLLTITPVYYSQLNYSEKSPSNKLFADFAIINSM